MPEILKRKPCDPPTNPPPLKQRKKGDMPRTSAQLPKASRQNLTLSDWLIVYSYVDSHPDVPQADIVQHFGSLPTGALVFTQSTLSQKLRDRPKMEVCVNDNPTALSSKKPHNVVRPDVERALYLWFLHMENKGDIYYSLNTRRMVARNKTYCDVLISPVGYGSSRWNVHWISSGIVSLGMHCTELM